MAKKRILVYVDEDLDKRWKAVAKKMKMTKSGMVEDFLNEIVPIFEKENPRDVMKEAIEHIGKGVSDMGSLFHAAEHDQSIEDYKKMKRG